jgi:hypothetical protein
MKWIRLIGMVVVTFVSMVIILQMFFPSNWRMIGPIAPVFTLEKATMIDENTLEVELKFEKWDKRDYDLPLDERKAYVCIKRNEEKIGHAFFPEKEASVGETIIVRVSGPNWQPIKGEKVKVEVVYIPWNKIQWWEVVLG